MVHLNEDELSDCVVSFSQSDTAFVQLQVSDNGMGMDAAIIEKIFDPFFTTKKSGEGSGLGLDIIKRIVEDHSAKISFQSVEGEGTTFYVVLPIKNNLIWKKY